MGGPDPLDSRGRHPRRLHRERPRTPLRYRFGASRRRLDHSRGDRNATRTEHAATQEKVAETKARSDAIADLDREAKAILARKLAGQVTEADGNVPSEPGPRTSKPAALKAKAPAKRTRKPAARRDRFVSGEGDVKVKRGEDDGIDWTSKVVANRVVKMKQSGKTIKEITAELGLPAEQKFWMKVSIVWRMEADRLGLDRLRHSAEVVARRVATRKAKRTS